MYLTYTIQKRFGSSIEFNGRKKGGGGEWRQLADVKSCAREKKIKRRSDVSCALHCIATAHGRGRWSTDVAKHV
jgi:hypothetical protein